jgi:hypothetical protein
MLETPLQAHQTRSRRVRLYAYDAALCQFLHYVFTLLKVLPRLDTLPFLTFYIPLHHFNALIVTKS